MIVPDFWDEHKEKRKLPNGRQATITRFGWSEFTQKEAKELAVKRVEEAFDFRPQAIIDVLNLRSPIFSRTAAGGHFGRYPDEDGGFSWEKLHEEKMEFLRA